MSDVLAHSPTKWEYRVLVKQTDRQMLLEINQMGKDGWEAIAMSYDKDLKGVWNWTGWLKRPAGGWSEEGRPAAMTGVLNAPAGSAGPSETVTEGAPSPNDGFDLSDGDFELKD